MPTPFQTALAAVTARRGWAEKQLLFSRMRSEGLRRRRKPYPGAADLHHPLLARSIAKLKPFYFNTVLGGERVAEFVALNAEAGAATGSAADYFNFQVRERSNFELELLLLIEWMLLHNRAVLRVSWDARENALRFHAVDPMLFLAPAQESVACDALDWFVEIQQLTRAQYEADPRLLQGEELLKRITGGQEQSDLCQKAQETAAREGITYSTDTDTILVWNHHTRTLNGWTVSTYSPAMPETPLRAPYQLPYRFNGRPVCNYVAFSYDVIARSWYSGGGVGEAMAPFEAWACKLWNSKADAMDFSGKPLFSVEGEVRNLANIQFRPGEVLPQGMQAVQMPTPPISFDQEMLQTERIAEESIHMPDAGVPSSDPSRTKATATEIDFRRALAGQGVDLKGRIFKMSLAKLLRAAWAVLVWKQPEDTAYLMAGEMKTLPQQALADVYSVGPSGATDNWNRTARFQKATQRLQMFNGDPTIDQDALRRGVLEADDPKLVRELFIGSGTKAATEAEDEAIEVSIMMQGWPAVVLPNEDHATRIKVLFGKLQQMAMTGAPADPIAIQRLQQHLATHVQMLAQTNPSLAKQIVAAATTLDPGAQAAGQPPGAPAAPTATGNTAPPELMPGAPPTTLQQAPPTGLTPSTFP